MNKAEFAAKVKRHLLVRDMCMKDLADRLNCSVSAVYAAMNKGKAVQLGTVRKFADAFDVPVSEF